MRSRLGWGQAAISAILGSTMRKQPVTRRQFLGSGIAAAGAISIGGALPANARDWEEYAARFDRSISDGCRRVRCDRTTRLRGRRSRKNYDVTNKITNLENGYWGIMANPVLAEYKRLTEFINKENTTFARPRWSETYRGVRDAVAGFLNVGPDEIALTRGATEALQALIAETTSPAVRLLYPPISACRRFGCTSRQSNFVRPTFRKPATASLTPRYVSTNGAGPNSPYSPYL